MIKDNCIKSSIISVSAILSADFENVGIMVKIFEHDDLQTIVFKQYLS